MQHLNNDMDELMRKAAEHYPLKPIGADWEKVEKELTAGKESEAPKKVNYGKHTLFLLSFLLLGYVCDHLFLNSDMLNGNSINKEQAEKNKKVNYSNSIGEKIGGYAPVKNNVADQTNSTKLFPNNLLLSNKRLIKQNKTSLSDAVVIFVNPQKSNGETLDEKDITGSEEKSSVDIPKIEVEVTNIQAPASETIFKNTEEAKQEEKEIKIKEKEVEDKQKKGHSFYISFVAGPDISTVKFQKTKDLGYHAGALVGYQFFKNWSVETGILWDRKNYYSKGSYFKMDKLKLPNHSKIVRADGYCNMFEWPINLRYQFSRRERSTWYASAGISSYLMQKEEYNYLYERYNIQYYGKNYYQKSSRDWLAVGNVSVSYEHKLGQFGKLRIEPYVKFPFRGVGVGSLPLSSTGIYFVISHPLK
ncbi:MAG: outer membrane beta-barrel protein [Flavisolibacter sp.]|nr:outer membrane beta-barrel protein [Flavisolibacter sp.]